MSRKPDKYAEKQIGPEKEVETRDQRQPNSLKLYKLQLRDLTPSSITISLQRRRRRRRKTAHCRPFRPVTSSSFPTIRESLLIFVYRDKNSNWGTLRKFYAKSCQSRNDFLLRKYGRKKKSIIHVL